MGVSPHIIYTHDSISWPRGAKLNVKGWSSRMIDKWIESYSITPIQPRDSMNITLAPSKGYLFFESLGQKVEQRRKERIRRYSYPSARENLGGRRVGVNLWWRLESSTILPGCKNAWVWEGGRLNRRAGRFVELDRFRGTSLSWEKVEPGPIERFCELMKGKPSLWGTSGAKTTSLSSSDDKDKSSPPVSEESESEWEPVPVDAFRR